MLTSAMVGVWWREEGEEVTEGSGQRRAQARFESRKEKISVASSIRGEDAGRSSSREDGRVVLSLGPWWSCFGRRGTGSSELCWLSRVVCLSLYFFTSRLNEPCLGLLPLGPAALPSFGGLLGTSIFRYGQFLGHTARQNGY